MKKLHVQERAVEEVKLAIKPFYQKREVTKDEYKDILRKAVQKVGGGSALGGGGGRGLRALGGGGAWEPWAGRGRGLGALGCVATPHTPSL